MAFDTRVVSDSDCDTKASLTKGTSERTPLLHAELRSFLAARLRSLYASSVQIPQPTRITELLAQVEAAFATRDLADPRTFHDELLALLPDLRGFALSIAKDTYHADDLVQEAVLKAWQKQHLYQSGTNLKAWLFTILRNQFYTQHRRFRREVEDVDGAAAGRLVALCDQIDRVALNELLSRIDTLPEPQQEALHLVAIQGMTYEEAADVLQCQVGTVKSRVSRARDTLTSTAARRRPRLHLATSA